MQLEYFQLIDRIVALDLEAKTITVNAVVPQTSTIFEGHFPGRPLMPGVLLIEAMAQASGWLLIAAMDFKRMPFLAAVKDAKMRRFVEPGETLEIGAKIAHEGSGFAMTDAEIRIAGKKTCNASITFSHVPFPNDELRRHMLGVAERIGLPQPAGVQAGTHG
jgi:3-hydroxyacyl-[acyl-carrier-protein] dehydratase